MTPRQSRSLAMAFAAAAVLTLVTVWIHPPNVRYAYAIDAISLVTCVWLLVRLRRDG